MSKWKYTLETNGKILRDLVDSELSDNEDELYAKIIEHLVVCVKQIMDMIGNEDDYDYEQFSDLHYQISGEAEVIRNDPDEIHAWSFSGAQELVNERLATFYDLCDSARVWIAV